MLISTLLLVSYQCSKIDALSSVQFLTLSSYLFHSAKGQSDDSDLREALFNKESYASRQTMGAFIMMSPTHPAKGYDIEMPNIISNSENTTIKISESSAGLEFGTKSGITAFEQYSGGAFIKTVADLPFSGQVNTIPWPSEYWPNYKDGINVRSDPSQQTAVEKYAQAFNQNVQQIKDEVSKLTGVDRWAKNRQCGSDNDCPQNDLSKCSIREGRQTGYCIPLWYGICHAWAPAAISEPEPRCAVTYNGVTFGVMDLKALLTQIYDQTGAYGTVFAGSRCFSENPSQDQYGRYINNECKDTTPDFVHLALTNMVGRFKKSILIDITAQAQVWNQPVLSYQILQSQQLSNQEAAQMVQPGMSTYLFNTEATQFSYFKTQMSYITEGASDGPISGADVVSEYTTTTIYEYVLEMDPNGVIIGGEWVNDSKINHPDFVWFPTSRPKDDTVVAGGIRYDEVRRLVVQSSQCTSTT